MKLSASLTQITHQRRDIKRKMRFDKQRRHSLHAAQQVMAEQTERRGGRIKSAAWRGSAAVLTEILTVDANMDPPNHTAYLCMWWVMTWTSIGLGWGEKKRRISYNSVVAGWLNAVAECSQVHLLCTALLLVQHWSTLYFGFFCHFILPLQLGGKYCTYTTFIWSCSL